MVFSSLDFVIVLFLLNNRILDDTTKGTIFSSYKEHLKVSISFME